MGLMIPVQAVIIPLTIGVTVAGLRGHFFVIMLIFTAQYLPLAVFILVGFMRTIPTELEEAAYADGGGHLTIFWNVILPLSKSAMSTVIIFVFLYSWNDLLVPLVFTVGETQRTLSIGLLSFFGGMTGQSSYGAFMAAALFAILPPIVLYLVASERVQQGLDSRRLEGLKWKYEQAIPSWRGRSTRRTFSTCFNPGNDQQGRHYPGPQPEQGDCLRGCE